MHPKHCCVLLDLVASSITTTNNNETLAKFLHGIDNIICGTDVTRLTSVKAGIDDNRKTLRNFIFPYTPATQSPLSRYRIRFVPIGMQPPFEGRVYATATEVGEPVPASGIKLSVPSPLSNINPNSQLRVQWEVCRTEDGKYTITQPGFQSKLAGIGPVQCGWSLAHPSEVRPTGSILFKPDAIGFYLEPTGEGEYLMYSVEVPKHGEIVGVRFFATEGDQNLVSAPFMAGVEFPPPHPHWQFIPA